MKEELKCVSIEHGAQSVHIYNNLGSQEVQVICEQIGALTVG